MPSRNNPPHANWISKLAKLATCAAAACAAALLGHYNFLLFESYVPARNFHGLDVREPVLILTLGALTTGLVALAAGRSLWSSAVWAARAWLIGLAYFAWRTHALTTYRQWLICASLAVFGLVWHHVAHRYALGWIVDANGERQKVEHWNRGSAIYTPTTRGQRLVLEAMVKEERRKQFLWMGAAGWPLAYVAYTSFRQHQNLMVTIVEGFFAATLLTGWSGSLLTELLYQTGYQDMKGAKVVDDPVKRPGFETVQGQMAHGDASLAGEAEAIELLRA